MQTFAQKTDNFRSNNIQFRQSSLDARSIIRRHGIDGKFTNNAPRKYSLQKGDTYWSISKRSTELFGKHISVDELEAWNPGVNYRQFHKLTDSWTKKFEINVSKPPITSSIIRIDSDLGQVALVLKMDLSLQFFQSATDRWTETRKSDYISQLTSQFESEYKFSLLSWLTLELEVDITPINNVKTVNNPSKKNRRMMQGMPTDIGAMANNSGNQIISSAPFFKNLYLDEGDVKASAKRGSFPKHSQIPAIHEFGHFVGLMHPGDKSSKMINPMFVDSVDVQMKTSSLRIARADTSLSSSQKQAISDTLSSLQYLSSGINHHGYTQDGTKDNMGAGNVVGEYERDAILRLFLMSDLKIE